MFTTRIRPKISVKPLATTKYRADSDRPLSVTVTNWSKLSAALIAIQTTTTTAMTMSTTRPADQRGPPLVSDCGCAGAEGAPAASGPPPGPECTVSDMSLTGIES